MGRMILYLVLFAVAAMLFGFIRSAVEQGMKNRKARKEAAAGTVAKAADGSTGGEAAGGKPEHRKKEKKPEPQKPKVKRLAPQETAHQDAAEAGEPKEPKA